jgi:6-phosphogluconolactonase
MRTLFKERIPSGCSVFRIEAEGFDSNAIVNNYAEKLPQSIDVMLLSLGDDAHVASLFPHSKSLREMTNKVLFVPNPLSSYNRITISPLVIQQAKFIYMLVSGETKSNALSKVFSDCEDIHSLPARIVPNAVWLIDQELLIKKA